MGGKVKEEKYNNNNKNSSTFQI